MSRSVCLPLLLALWCLGCEPGSNPETVGPFGDMVLVPGGEFELGANPSPTQPAFVSDRTSSQSAQPRQKMSLEPFYLDRYEVTYGDFLRFKPRAAYADGRLDQPVRGVSWYEAEAYCFWLGKRLPTEFEWEKAARGTDGRRFVWGNEFHREFANFGKTVKRVGSFEDDKSPFGIYDLNGNVSEWTASWYAPYPRARFEDPNFGKKFRVIRGGAINRREHGFMEVFTHLSFRNLAPPKMRSWDTGFRCARSAPRANSNSG